METKVQRHRGSTVASAYEIDSTPIVSPKYRHQNVHSSYAHEYPDDYHVEYYEEEDEEEDEKEDDNQLVLEGKTYDFANVNLYEQTGHSSQEITPIQVDEELTTQPEVSTRSSISQSSHRQSLRLKQIHQIGLISEDRFRCRFIEVSRSRF